jgi:branched-chain amino acid transport system ATP-binding protein
MLLEVKDIHVRYGKVEVIRGVSLDVEEGGLVALLGANGAGKTTLLKTISALHRPASGEIWFSGQRIDNIEPSRIVRMGVGHVPEGRQLFPDMTIEDNLTMGAYLRNDAENVQKEISEFYEHFPILKNRRKQRAGSMSGGEQQLLAICRALMSRPKLLIMDEPSIGLSPIMVQEIASIVKNINMQGIGVLLVEQNAALGLELGKRAYVMELGQIVLSGNSAELINNDQVKTAYLGI